MKTNYLLPNRFKKTGWFLLITGVILGIIYLAVQESPDFLNFKVFAVADQDFLSPVRFFTMVKTNVFDEIIALLLIFGSVFIALSKEKTEDEYISKIRLESLVWATYVNYAVLVLTIIFVYGLAFLWVLVFNMFTILFFFLIRFNWIMVQTQKRTLKDEK